MESKLDTKIDQRLMFNEHSLTDHEKKFIYMYCKGYKQREINAFIKLPIRGIANFERTVMQKLGAKTKLKMILNAIQLGYVKLDHFEFLTSEPEFVSKKSLGSHIIRL